MKGSCIIEAYLCIEFCIKGILAFSDSLWYYKQSIISYYFCSYVLNFSKFASCESMDLTDVDDILGPLLHSLNLFWINCVKAG